MTAASPSAWRWVFDLEHIDPCTGHDRTPFRVGVAAPVQLSQLDSAA